MLYECIGIEERMISILQRHKQSVEKNVNTEEERIRQEAVLEDEERRRKNLEDEKKHNDDIEAADRSKTSRLAAKLREKGGFDEINAMLFNINGNFLTNLYITVSW